MLHSTQIDDDDESLGSVFSLSNGSSVSAGGGFSSTDPPTHQPPLLRTSTMNADSSAPARGAIGTPSRPNVAESALARTPNPNEFDTTMRTPSSSTPRRNASRSNESSSYSGTPSSRFGRLRNTPRINPFESTAIDRLKFPTMSPSIFNTVQSPSQENPNGQFWTLEQQANLYPADISVDSPWKQDTGTSQMDPEMERSTQEAIDVYFSHHHTVTSPDDSQPSLSRLNPMTSSQSVPNMPMDMGSPLLPSRNNTSESKLAASTAKLLSNFNGKAPKVKTATTQWTQTNLSLPPVLPDDVTRVLQGYMNFNNVQQDEQPKVVVEMQDLETSCSSNSANSSVAPAGISSGGNEELQHSSLSNSTLRRRKLFDEMISSSDDEDEGDAEAESRCGVIKSSPLKPVFFSPEPTNRTTPKSVRESAEKNSTWSSSPLRRSKSCRRTSMSPPESLGSPSFSPIGKENVN